MSEITAFVTKRYADYGGKAAQIVTYMEHLWSRYQKFADPHFVTEFCSGNEDRLFERFWEMQLTCTLQDAGLPIEPGPSGPDIKIAADNHVVWVEAVVAGIGEGKNQLPAEYLNPKPDISGISSYAVPHEQILLRWTAAINAKYQKYKEYESSRIVGTSDPQIIAVNSCRLGMDGFDGISQLPAALEAVYPVGPIQIHLDKRTLESVGQSLVHRPTVLNANQSAVLTNSFLNPDHASIAGILAAHIGPMHAVFGGGRNPILVHNILAANPLPRGFFGIKEYWLEPISQNEYRICN